MGGGDDLRHAVPENILRVDLTRKKVVKQSLPDELARNYLGGRGANAKILWDELKAGVDPLSPDNILVFGIGPANGTLAPASGRYNVSAKSPLTGFFGDANSGGHWAAELKYAGYGNLVFYGRADKPVYLWIDDDDVELRDATRLWGKDTWETEDTITEELGDPEIKVACIGPAGENLVRCACVINEKTRAAGRTGMGAVMGSKNLKAIAIRGTKSVKVADPEGLFEFRKEANALISTDLFYELYAKYGTPGLMTIYNEFGAQTHYNSKEGYAKKAEDNLYGEVYVERVVKHVSACFSCPLHCSAVYAVDSGPYACVGESCEYENLTAYGSRCGNYNLESVVYASTLADKLGMDTISSGATIGFAMECWEKGLLDEKSTEGLILEWGNAEAIIEALRRMAYRKGKFGNLLAEGTKRMSEKIPGSEKFAIHIKGLDTPAVDPRGMMAYGGLGYAVASRGGDHLRALAALGYSLPGKAKELFGSEEAADRFSIKYAAPVVKFHEEMRAIADSLDICKYITRTALLLPEIMAKLINVLTGWGIDRAGVLRIGERIVNIERAFNVREGLTRKDDTQPERFLKEPLKSGPSAGHVVNLKPMLDDYYRLRGWDLETGYPTRGKLEELGLSDVADELKRIGRLAE
jgi:aldehyde:ferredoxin oxidoreductase